MIIRIHGHEAAVDEAGVRRGNLGPCSISNYEVLPYGIHTLEEVYGKRSKQRTRMIRWKSRTRRLWDLSRIIGTARIAARGIMPLLPDGIDLTELVHRCRPDSPRPVLTDMSDGYKRVPSLWFPDGNLVLRVDRHLFRVHTSILSLHSSFFRDMSALSKPDAGETYDGAALVTLSDDDPRDVRQFLKAVYIPQYFLPYPAPTTFPIIEGVLRIAHKYDAHILRRTALQLLCKSNVIAEQMLVYAYAPEAMYPRDSASAIAEVKAIITLARDVQALWLLPNLMYRTMSWAPHELFSTENWEGRDRRLTQEDIIRVLAGAQSLRKLSIPHNVLFVDDLGCPLFRPSQTCLQRRTISFNQDILVGFQDAPLTCLTWVIDTAEVVDHMCRDCAGKLRKNFREWRVALWRQIPNAFDLPEWPELTAMQQSDLEPLPVSNQSAEDELD
ncbi:uncharacterized protein SCHCODRAFT_01092028 [Schizophyllum commune H4-8]|nr:uncharacterized protein SCHCODRAFT_01092028 [Schizophyllum commune H4-8]KAI5896506.1 hypothetical protein SCHCODRAFT_01092028 [Schizophyllum commune H4-8]